MDALKKGPVRRPAEDPGRNVQRHDRHGARPPAAPARPGADDLPGLPPRAEKAPGSLVPRCTHGTNPLLLAAPLRRQNPPAHACLDDGALPLGR